MSLNRREDANATRRRVWSRGHSQPEYPTNQISDPKGCVLSSPCSRLPRTFREFIHSCGPLSRTVGRPAKVFVKKIASSWSPPTSTDDCCTQALSLVGSFTTPHKPVSPHHETRRVRRATSDVSSRNARLWSIVAEYLQHNHSERQS